MPDQLSKRIRRRALAVLIIGFALGVWGVLSRVLARSSLAQQTQAAAIPTVVIVKPAQTTAGEDLVLPGTVQAFAEASIYARTNGYLKHWHVDIGTQVVKGQLLADIDSPEVDQQLSQAQAELESAQANAALAESTNARWRGLLATESVSKQDAEEKAGDAAAKKAAVQSAGANVARLRELASFKRVVAPFGGVITARNTEIGALISAGQNSGAEMFRIADTHTLRIYVRVPEAYAAAVPVGLDAELRFSEQPRKVFAAKTVRTSKALDPASRTLQVELELDNATHEVLPGSYTEVHFKLPAGATALRLPSNALLFRAAGMQVAIIDEQKRVTLKNVVQGRDFGESIEILSGLAPDDAVILNPPDSLIDGAQVRIASHGAK